MRIAKPEEYDALKEIIEKHKRLWEAFVLSRLRDKEKDIIPDEIPNTKDYLLD